MNDLDTLNVAEAAEYLKCSKNTIRNKAANGELPGLKVGKQYVFLRGELANLLRKAKTKLINEMGDKKCPSISAKVHPISSTVSGTKVADTVLAQALVIAKKRNRLKPR